MSEAVMNLITREAVELHFEGATYGPVEHTEALGTLLFLLQPQRVRCVGRNAQFEAALVNLLTVATEVTEKLEDAFADCELEPSPPSFAHWLSAAWRVVPAERRAAVSARFELLGGRWHPSATAH